MYYSVTFTNMDGEKRNTWDDWHLIPMTPPMIPPFQPVYNYVDIPGRKAGPIDLTGVLGDGSPGYQNSTGSWEFALDDDATSRVELTRTLSSFLNGTRMEVMFEEDPDHYWMGRFSLNAVKTGREPNKFTVNFTIEPTEYLRAASSIT